ncbi:receptor-like protein EIX1 [Prosopis cineraria]|uniref:receptor-like protein EIX1 n=1 Tax=Prosopis cineraria TaxID=364024 RepID=UPI00240EC92E|nr:receptor-like protein EIX1 [Prosopis cineraria]XP_054816637.1 receptor-like protein EIX1 [Prosopis cineraria]XP_054816638.1 receptor-like protein EIX1 [Prosopis cineraria]
MHPNSLKLLQTIFLVWVSHVQVLQVISGSIGCKERERQALLELKKGFVDDYGILSSWSQHGDSDTDCCSWWGIECSNHTGHVLILDLRPRDYDKSLRGEISASLVELQHLNYLDLSWNHFRGNPIPEFIGSLVKLRHLYLSHASFGGKIPYQLGNLSNLEVLHLYVNDLIGEIPWELGNLLNLQQLMLQFNHLGGLIPYQLGNLSRLEVLHLGSNDNLQIENIQWISHLSSLTSLDIGDQSNLRKSKNWLQIIGQLPNLQILSLSNCNLSYMDLLLVHPSQLNISNSLAQLDLSGNMFTSSIFPWLFHLNSSLDYLDLNSNLLEGPIPDDLGKIMNSLQTLHLNGNQLNGTLPKTIANLLELNDINVASNFLEGGITNLASFANLTNLKLLDLSRNSFTLKFSNNWIPQFQLAQFVVQSCTLGPSIPKWLQTQNDLNYLDVSDTRISDMATATAFLCSNKRRLNFLNMSSNHFKGQLPNCWNQLASLRILDLSNNEFFGEIPSSMGSLHLMRHLILRGNHFTGQIPSLKNCTQLVMLDVGRNKLSGPIPLWIGYNLQNLQVLSMRKNHFHGSLPLHLCHLKTIQVLDLSMNNLSGKIPKCLQNFSAMAQKPTSTIGIDEFYTFINGSPSYFFLYDFYPTVRWKGKELSFKDNKRLLKLIDISVNELYGKIPIEIGNLSELVSLDLSSNNLSGEIPRELGNLHDLEFLDLSTNHLSGTIPSSLSKINWLSVLNLSNNNLSGKIPSGTQLQGFDASSYDGNPYLCGSPLKRLCPNEGSEPPLNFGKHEDEKDDSFFTQGFYISMGLGFVTGFWAIFGSLLIFRSWRHAYFTFLNNLYERIVVVTIINLARCRRLLRR